LTNIYLIRHAQVEGNLKKTFQGRTDTPLTALGEEQARQLAARFAAIPLDAVYTSPLGRAIKTAEAVAAPHGLTPAQMPGLIEIDGGGLENMSFEELAGKYPEEFDIFNRRPHLFEGAAGSESIRSVYERMAETMKEIANRHPGGNVAVISHGCPIRCFSCLAGGGPIERLGEVEWSRNTGVSHVVYEDGSFLLHSSDDLSHIMSIKEGQL